MTISDLLKNPRLPHRVMLEPLPGKVGYDWVRARFMAHQEKGGENADDASWQIPDLGGEEW